MATVPAQTVNLQKAKNNLQQLVSTLSPDLQLLNGLQEEIGKTLNAGATVKQIWISLREAGFKGNQTKLANWLQEKGLREKMIKKGSGKRKKAETASPQASSQSTDGQTIHFNKNFDKKTEKSAEKKQDSGFQVDDDNY